MNLDDRHHSILSRNYSGGLDTRKRPSSSSFNSNSAKKSKGESKANRRVLLRLLSLSTGFDPQGVGRDGGDLGGWGGHGGSSSFRRGHAKQGKCRHKGPSICTSSFSSSGCSSVKFCGGLVIHNSGFLGPFCSGEGLQDSFCKEPLLSSSPILFPVAQQHLKKVREKSRGVPQSQTAALPRPQEEEETDKSKQAQTKQKFEKHQD